MRIMITTNSGEHAVFTGWPLLQQLCAIGSEIKLTANTPYPCFMVCYGAHTYLFTPNGGTVSTMLGNFGSFGFNEVVDIRTILPELHWKEDW